MKKVRAVQTKDYIADAIRNEILAGNMEQGEELTQETLAEMLGVSRMPVREALQLLEQEGFIERLANRHMVVAQLEEHKLEEIMGMAAAIEAEITVQLCGKSPAATVRGENAKGMPGRDMGIGDAGSGIDNSRTPAQILEAMSQALKAGQTEQAARWELEYHGSLVTMLENPYIEQVFRKILGGYVAYMIQKLEHDLGESHRLLCAVQEAMKDGSRDPLYECLQQYYRALLVSWNRKGRL